MQAITKNFALEIVIVTLHLNRCCSTIKISCYFPQPISWFMKNLSVALLHSSYIVQFSRCRSSKQVYLAKTTMFSSLFWSQISKSNSLGFEIQQQITVWWARVGANHRPCDYQSHALASWATGPYQLLVENNGIEPLTSWMQIRRSPSWANPPSISQGTAFGRIPSKLNNVTTSSAPAADLRKLQHFFQALSSP